MPLDFKEVGPDPKAKENSQKARLEALAERKGKGPAPLYLDSQVIPTLVRKVGDWKTGRISQAMCEAFLDRHTLVFNRELLTKMFAEADYQKEGSLDTRALGIAISGRFPKREHTADWHVLVALLLGLPELVLVEDVEAATLRKKVDRPGGTYNATSFWDSPPPPLPPVRRRTGSGRPTSSASSESGGVTAREPSAEWNDTMSRTAAAAAIAGAVNGGSGSGTGSLNATLRSGSAGGALDATGALAGGAATAASSGIVSTTGGLKQVTQVPDEQRLNSSLVGSGTGTAGRLTFATLRDFNDFARGLEVAPQLTADSAGPGPGSAAASTGGGATAARLGSPKSTVRVWAAPLPPSAISLPSSALRTLRESVRSTTASKAEFGRAFKPLDSHELDLKKTLGQDMDMQRSLARVEPVRGTKVLPHADYVTWCDYAANCRTSPGGWYSTHPVAAVQDTGDHKYPWC